MNSSKIFLCFRFCIYTLIKLIGQIIFRIHVDIDASPPNYTFAFAFVILKVINSEIILFRFALISVSIKS